MERHSLRRFYGRQILRGALFASTALVMPLVAPRVAIAQIAPNTTPQGGVVVGGSAAIAQGTASTIINQASPRAAINWQSFDVGSAAKVQFNQPSASAIALNRVTGGNLSQINGQINANGQIVLINQSGVVFGKGAQVNAESVVVSTSDIAPGDFMAGRMVFSGAPKPGAQIVNNGVISAREAGLVGLVAPQVINNGMITATLGQVVLAGASAFTLDLYGDRLISLDVTQAVRAVDVGGKPVPALITNNGVILADGGKITLSAQDADALVTQLINAGGIIRANTVGAQTGTISLQGIGGNIQIAGNLLAQGTAPGSKGGAIQVLADGTVAETSTGNIDASGNAGGGVIALGTDLTRAQTGPADTAAPAAAVVTIAPGASIHADATGLGNAGTVTLLSQDFTGFGGAITGQGGPAGGNGGLTEISSRGEINLGGTVLETAINGQPGEILLDPNNLYVTAGGGTGSVTGGGTVTFGGTGTGGGDSLVDPAQLNSLSGTVILEAAKLISVASTIDMTNASALSLVSGGSISVTASIFVDGSLDLDAAGSLFIGAELIANNILLTSGPAGTNIDGFVTASSNGPGTGVVTLGSGGTIAEDAIKGTLYAQTLLGFGAIGGDLLLDGTNDIFNLGSLNAAGHDITLIDGGPLTVLGKVNAGNISLVGVQLILDAPVSATGTLALDTTCCAGTGTITQNLAGSISAATLALSTGTGNVFLTTPNNSFANVLGTTTGTLALADAENLDIISGLTGASVFINLGAGDRLTLDPTHGTIDATASGGVLSLVADTLSVPAVTGAIKAPNGTIAVAPATANRTITVSDEAGGAGLSLGSAFLTAIKNGADELLIGNGSFTGAIDLGQDSGDLINLFNVPLSVATSGAVTTNGEIDATTLAFDAGSFIQSSGTLVLGRIEGTANGSITLGNGLNLIGTFGAMSASGNILLADDEAAVFDGLITTSGVLKLQNIGGGFAETGNGTLDVGDLTTGSGFVAGNVTLDQVNAIGTLDEFQVSGAGHNFLLNDSGPLTITNAVTVPGQLTLKDLTGGISESGIGAITTATLTSGGATIGGDVSLSGGNGINTLGGFLVGSLDSFYLDNSDSPLQVAGAVSGDFITLAAHQISLSGDLTAFGSLELDSVTDLFQTGGSITAGTLGGDITGTGNVSLTAATNDIGTLGNFTVAHGNLLLTDSTGLKIQGLVSTPNEVLISAASVGEIGSGAVKAGTLAGSASGAITLGGTNTIAKLGSLLSGGDIYLADTGKLTVIDTVTGADVTISVPTLSLDADIFATNAASATLALATNDLTVTAGTFNVSTGGGTGTIFVAPFSANTAIDLAGTTANALDLSPSVIAAFDPAATEIVLGFAPVGTQATAIDIDGSVSFSNGTLVDLATSGAILDNAGTLSAGTLAFDAASFSQSIAAALNVATLEGDGGRIGGSVSLPGTANLIGALANMSLSAGVLSLTDAATLTVEGLVTAPKIYLTDAAGIGFAGSLVAASGGTIALTSDALFTTATASTISAPGGTVVLAPYTATDAIDFGGTGFAGLTLGDALLELIGAGILAIGTQGGGTIYTEGSVSLTANELLLTGASIDLTGTLALPGLLSFSTATDLSETAGATLSAGTVAGTAGGNILLTSGNDTIGTLGRVSLATDGTLAVIDTGTLTIAGAIDPAEVILFGSLGLDIATNVSATLLEIGSGGTVIQSGGSITAGTLESYGSIGGDAYLTQAGNAIGTLAAFTLGGLLDLIDTGLLDVAGPVAGGNISLTAGTIDLSGLVDAGTLIALGSTGTITQTGGTLIAPTLSSIGTIGGDALLDGGANTIATLAGFFTAGTLALDDTGSALTLAGTVRAATATLNAAGLAFDGYLTIAGLLDLAGTAGATEASTGTITTGTLGSVGAITGGDVSLTAAHNNIGTLGNFTLAGALALNDTAALTIAGTVTTAGEILLTGAGLTETTGALDAGTLTTGAGAETGDVRLTGSNDVLTLDAFTVTGGHTLALHDAGALTITGTVNAAVTTLSAASTIDIASDIFASTELALGSAGTITQTAGTITTGTLVSDGSIGGDVELGSPFAAGADSIATLGNFTLGGNLLLGDFENLDVTGRIKTTGGTAKIILEDASTITAGGTLIGAEVGLSASSSIDLTGVIDAATLFALGGGAISQTGGSIVAGTLSSGNTTISGNVSLTGAANTIAALGSFFALGDFALADTGSLAIDGSVAAADIALTAPTIGLDASVDATATGGTLALVADEIVVTAGTFGVVAGTIALAPLTAGYGIDLGGTAANALDITGAVANMFGGTPAEILIGQAQGSTASFIDIDSSVSFGAATLVDLTTPGGIFDNVGTLSAQILEFDAASFAQSIGAAIDVATLQGDGGTIENSVLLIGTANEIGTLGAMSLAAGTLALTDAAALLVAGTVSAPKIYLTDSNAGGIDFAGALLAATGGTIGLISDALGTTATASTISAPDGKVIIAPYTAGDAIDLGGTSFGGLELPAGLISFISTGLLQLGTGGGEIFAEGSVSMTPAILLLDATAIDVTGTLAGPGLLSLAASGDITENPAAAIDFATLVGSAATIGLGGANTIGTIGNVDATGAIILNDLTSAVIAGIVSTSGSISLEGDAFRETGTGALDAQDLNSGGTTIGGDLFLTGANSIATLADLYLTGGATLALADAQPLTLAGTVVADFASLSAGTLDFNGFLTAANLLALASDFVTQTSGTISAGTLTSLGSIGGDVVLTGANAIGTLANFSVGAGDTLALTDATALTLTGTDIAPNASLTADGIDFAGTFDAAFLLLLGGAGNVTQTAGTIIAGTLATDGNLGGEFSVLGPNQIGTLGGIGALGDIAINDTQLLDIAGLVSTTGTITLEGTGGIDEIAGGTLAAARLNSGGTAIGGDVFLTNANAITTLADFSVASGHTLAFADAGSLTLAGTVIADFASLSGGFLDFAGIFDAASRTDLASTGNVTQTSGTIITGTLVSAATIGGDVTLLDANTISHLGQFTLAAGHTLSLADAGLLTVDGPVFAPVATLAAASIALDGNIDATALALESAGAIHQLAGTIGAGTLSSGGTTIGGDVTLGDANEIATLANFYLASGGTLALSDARALTLAGSIFTPYASLSATSLDFEGFVTAASLLQLASTGAITQGGGTIDTPTLTSLGSINGNVGLTALNAIGTLGNFALGAGDTLALTDAGSLNLAGAITAPFATFTAASLAISGNLDAATLLALVSAGGIAETGGITAGTLTSLGSLDGSTGLTGSNTIATLGVFAVGAGDEFLLDDTGLLTVAGPVTGPTISLFAGTIAIPGTIDAGALLALDASGGITETGVLSAPTLTSGGGTIGGGETLAGANTIVTLGDIFLAGNFALTNTGTLIIAGSLATPTGDVTLADNASVTETTGAIYAGTLDTGGTTLGGNLQLDSANTIGSLSALTLGAGFTFNLADSGLLTVAGTVFAPTATIAADSFVIAGALDGNLLALASAGTIHETTGTIAVATLTGIGTIGGDAYLTNSNVIGTLTNLTMAAGATLALTDLEALVLAGTIVAPDAILDAPTLIFNGFFNAGNVLALAGAASVVEGPDGAITAGTLTSLGSIDGDVLLLGAANTIGTIGNFTVGTGNTFALDDTGLLTVAGPLAGPFITLSSDTIAIPGNIAATELALESTGSITETTGAIFATTLTSGGTTIGGDLSLLGGNTIGTLGDLALAGNFGLNNTGTLDIAGTLQTPATVTLEDDAGIFEAAGRMLVGTLTSGGATIGGDADFNGASNTIGNLGDFTLAAGHTLVLDDTGLLTVAGTVFAPFATVSTDTLAIAGALDGTMLALANDGLVTETTGTIAVATLTSGGGTDSTVTLLNTNNIGTLGAFTASGAFALNDGAALNIAGIVTTASTITLEDAQSITEIAGGTLDAALLTSGGTTIGGAVTLLNANTIGQIGQFAAAGNISFDDAQSYAITGLLATGGTLALQGAGLSEAGGAISAATLVSIGTIAGSAALNGGNAIAALGGFNATGNLLLNDISALNLTGQIGIGGTLGLLDASNIIQTGGGITATALTSDGGQIGGGATLFAGANSIATLGAFSAVQNLGLNDLKALHIAGPVNLGGTLNIRDSSNVTQDSGTISAAVMSGQINGFALFNQAGNNIAALNNLTAAGGLSVVDGRNLALGGLVSTGGASLNLFDAGFTIAQTGGVITTGTLNANAAGIILPDANNIATMGQVSATYLRVAGVAAITGPVNAGSASITSPGNLLVNGNVNVANGLTLSAGALLGQTAGTITAGTAYLTGASISLAGDVFATENLADRADLQATAADGFTQSAGTISAATLEIRSDFGAVLQNAGATLTGRAIGLSNVSGTGMTIAGAISASGAVRLYAQNLDDEAALLQAQSADLTGIDGFLLNGNNVVTGLLTGAGNTIAQTGGLLQAGTIQLSAAAFGIQLGGAVLAQTGTFTVYGVPGAGTGLRLGGNVSVAGQLDLISNSGIYQTGGVVRAGAVTGTATYGAADNIVLDAPLYVSGALDLTAGGNITQNNSPLQASNASLDAGIGITLAGADRFDSFLDASANVFDQKQGGITAGTANISAANYLGINGAVSIATALNLTADNTLVDAASALYAATASLSSPHGNIILDGNNSVLNPLLISAAGYITQNFGNLSGPGASFTAGGNIVLNGNAAFTGDLNLVAGGNILHDTGRGQLTAGTLSGRAAKLAEFTAPTDFGTIGSFIMQDSTFILDNSGTLSILGPLVANAVSITAVGLVRLIGAPTGGLFITGQIEPKTVLTPQPGDSVITVRQGTNGATPLLLQTGTFYINAGPEAAYFPAFADQPATLFMEMLPNGNIDFAPAPPASNGLYGPSVEVDFGLGDTGTVSGNVDLLSVLILSGTASNFTGILDGVGGTAASSKGNVVPFPKPPFQFNACPIGSVNCIILPIETLPTANPLQNFDIEQRKRKRLDKNVALPGVATRDF